MQHHGIRTRLLDSSESLCISLYFATLNWNTSKPAKLWLLNPIKINSLSSQEEYVSSPKDYTIDSISSIHSSISIYPIKNNPRIIAQKGVFTIQENSRLPLKRDFPSNSNIIKSFDLNFDI